MQKVQSDETKAQQRFYGMAELAELWGVHRVTLSNYIKRIAHEIPLYKPGQRVFARSQYKKIAERLGFDI